VNGPTVGVVALQGAFALHIDALTDCGTPARAVRLPADLAGCDAVVLPGGESTTMGKLLDTSGLRDPLRERLAAGMPAFGTCAGLILCVTEVLDPVPNDASPFGVVDAVARRNAYGRQVESFETDLAIDAIGPEPFRAVFIRAPVMESVGPGVDVLGWQNDHAVLARQGPVLVGSFHPELTGDRRIHQYFVDLVKESM